MPPLPNLKSGRLKRLRMLVVPGVILLVAAAITVAVVVYENPRVTLVKDYLEALQDRDIERAMTYVDPARAEPVDGDGSYLTAEALSSDWEIIEVETVDGYPRFEAVRATIASRGVESEGDFFVGFPGEDDLAILNPYAMVRMPTEGFTGGIALNGFEPGHQPETVALFPGSYRLFDETRDEDQHALDPFVAMPNPSRYSDESKIEAWGGGGMIDYLAEELGRSRPIPR